PSSSTYPLALHVALPICARAGHGARGRGAGAAGGGPADVAVAVLDGARAAGLRARDGRGGRHDDAPSGVGRSRVRNWYCSTRNRASVTSHGVASTASRASTRPARTVGEAERPLASARSASRSRL